MSSSRASDSSFRRISNPCSATIILNEGHAAIGADGCRASRKILEASRAILNLLHEAYSTGHNLAWIGVLPMVRISWHRCRLDHHSPACAQVSWFAAGRVLIRFLRAALEAQSEQHVAILQTEVDFIRYG